MHKVYKNFLNGESKLIDVFKEDHPELHKQFHELWMILSKNHQFFSKPFATKEEKIEAADNCSQFTKKFPIYFPSSSITRKMHLMSDFVLPKMILADKTANICYKFLKVEQAGERLHQIWNLLNRTRFFSVRNGKSQLLYAFMEYENLLYIPK